jgi:hypothetical protein
MIGGFDKPKYSKKQVKVEIEVKAKVEADNLVVLSLS